MKDMVRAWRRTCEVRRGGVLARGEAGRRIEAEE